MPLYESTFIARPDISAQQVEALTDQFEEIVRTAGGEVAKKEYWGLRNLAFRIKKNRKGHYTYMNLEAPSDAIQEMERTMRISEDVIRYMTVRVDEFEDGPSVVMQSRGSRETRGRSDRGGFGGRERSEGRGDRDDKGDGASSDSTSADSAPSDSASSDSTPADKKSDDD